MTLAVPAPTLAQDGKPGPRFKADKPITVTCGPVVFPDGSRVGAAEATSFTYFVYKQVSGGAPQIWDEKGKTWVAANASSPPQSLFPAQDPALAGSWQAILVGAGQQDSGGRDKFATDPQTGDPTYFVRCSFQTKDSTGTVDSGISPQSQSVTILPVGAGAQSGLAATPMPPLPATEVKLFLKDPPLIQEAKVEITTAGLGFAIELSANGASLALTPAGDIVLKPAPGRTVQVQTTLPASQSLTVNGQQVGVP